VWDIPEKDTLVFHNGRYGNRRKEMERNQKERTVGQKDRYF
jgi:hypothetical protein